MSAPIFSAADLDVLSALHVQRGWFAEVDLPSGLRRLHTGMGPKTIGGYEGQGVSDPWGGQLVGVSGFEEPRFGQAVALDIVISGANRDFLKTMWDDRTAVEGVRCDMYFAVFDAETGETLIGLKKLFPGKLTAPRFGFVGTSVRVIQMKVVSVLEGLNFATSRSMWSPAGQRQRHPGDEGMDTIGSDLVEDYKA